MKRENQFNIVAADASHVKFLSSFGSKSFIDAYRNTLSMEELTTYTEAVFKPSIIQDEIVCAKAMYFIGQDSRSEPCGYLKLLPSPPPACIDQDGSIELQRLYVDKDHKAKGIGRLLARQGEAAAMQQALRIMWLRVWEENVLAQRIYLKWNYAIQGTETYQVGREERTVVLMSKTLGT